MKVLLINNAGAGFADYVEVEQDITALDLFRQHMGKVQPEDFLIRVNRLPVARNQVLQDGDRISITATKIEGALVISGSVSSGRVDAGLVISILQQGKVLSIHEGHSCQPSLAGSGFDLPAVSWQTGLAA